MSFCWTLRIETNWLFCIIKDQISQWCTYSKYILHHCYKKKEKASTKSSTSVKNTSHEASGKTTSVNETQENEHYSDVVSIEQASLLFKKDSNHAISQTMLYEKRKSIILKVLGVVIYCFIDRNVCVDYLCNKRESQLSSSYRGFEDT